MENTRLANSLNEKDLLAVGYDQHLQPLPRAPTAILKGSDGMRSTANDLLTFLAANIGLTPTPLAAAMADMLKTRRATQYAEMKVALGWHVTTLHGVEMVWLNGQTAGFRAFVGFVPKLRAGVVVLSNSANAIDDIGIHILDRETPLRNLHREAPINPGQFDNYVGRYQVDANFTITVSRDRGHLYIQGTGQPRAELFFEGDDKFFLRVVDAEVTFQTAENGRTHGLELRQGDKRVLATAVN